MKGHDSHRGRRGHREGRTGQWRRWKADDERPWGASVIMHVPVCSVVPRWSLCPLWLNRP